MQIGVVILNYNGWRDTLACVESVLASSMAPAWVVIVDNASPDDSIRWFRHWARGHMDFVLLELGVREIWPKPVELLEITPSGQPDIPAGSLALIRNTENRGCAAGNNVGIRLLMNLGADAVWILNNDTVVDKHALGAMARRLFAKPRPGLCGSLLRYMEGEGLVQCRGGGFANRWTGLFAFDGNGETLQNALRVDSDTVEGRINFIHGASVMASRNFIEEVGLLDEDYFLYCEEWDWSYRAGGRFDFAYASDAVVWHREGGTTGFSRSRFKFRYLWYLTRSRLLLTFRHNPIALPVVCAGIAFAGVRMVWRRLIRGYAVRMGILSKG